MIWLWSAFTLGFLGSLHCLGMCGPIAMALPLSTNEKRTVVLQSILYNFGRVSTYTIMGLVMGLLGWGILIAGYQKILSISLGIALILSAIFSYSLEKKLFGLTIFQRFFNRIKTRLANLLKFNSASNAYKIGLVNGILPCGLVYIALAGALASGNSVTGAAYMALFGLGTMPMMLGAMLFTSFNKRFFFKFRKFIPLVLIIFGLYLIQRGWLLEVPTDLRFWEANNFPVMCH
jgi:sulfite exporter TauE/SafE